MKISIITLFPNMFKGFLNESIIKRAQDEKLVDIELINLRDFAVDDYGSVDDRPYGGGVGMILRVDVIYKALCKILNLKFENFNENFKLKIKNSNTRIILTSARGIPYTQQKTQQLSSYSHMIIIAGHYEGVDERVLDYIDEEISIGDYVLTGGEIPTAVIVDSVVRLIPGVLKKREATRQESFSSRGDTLLLEYPQYTRPEEFKRKKVPGILLSGNHKKIEEWRMKQSIKITKQRRSDLLS